MQQWLKSITLVISLMLLPTFAFGGDDTRLKNRISDKVDELDYLRDELAMKSKLSLASESGKYLEACEVIQRDSVKMAKATGWKIRQPSKKPRNPINSKLSDAEKAAFEKFKASPRLGAYWIRDDSGFWYFRQIKTETKCLACHGPAGKRPQRVKSGYPNDRGFGFKDGEFYGVFSVFVADKKAKKKPKVVEEDVSEDDSEEE